VTAIVLAALGYFAFLALLYAILLYNGLVRVRERIGRAWAMIEVQLKRRADLIPRLAGVVKGYRDYEREVQEGLTSMRADASAGRAHAPKGSELKRAERAADEQTAMLTRVLATVEAYPELKSNELYLNLQRELSDAEDRIALARSFYNDTVTAYNERIGTLPDALFASLMKLGRVVLYQIKAFERRPVEVDLSPAEDQVEHLAEGLATLADRAEPPA
jgi:LemA protein